MSAGGASDVESAAAPPVAPTPEARLDALCALLRTRLGCPVHAGRPGTTVADLCVWPWRLVEPGNWRTPPIAARPHPVVPPLTLHALIVPGPIDDRQAIRRLAEAHAVLTAEPILSAAGGTTRVTHEELDVGSLTAVFLAASLPFVPCLAVRLDAP